MLPALSFFVKLEFPITKSSDGLPKEKVHFHLSFAVVINDQDNEVANKSVTSALRELREKSPSVLGQVYVAQINAENSTESLSSVCEVWEAVLGGNEADRPDFVLDTTTYGPGAETVNRFTALLGIPTLTAQYGQEGDLLGWREITEEQKRKILFLSTDTLGKF